MHKIAPLPEFALVALVEDLALAGAVQFRGAVGVLGSQLLYPVGEFAPVLVGAVPLFHEVLAQLHLDLAVAAHRLSPFRRGGILALAGFEGISFFCGLLAEFGDGEREGEALGAGRGVGFFLFVAEGVALPALGGGGQGGLAESRILGHVFDYKPMETIFHLI